MAREADAQKWISAFGSLRGFKEANADFKKRFPLIDEKNNLHKENISMPDHYFKSDEELQAEIDRLKGGK